MFCNLMLCIVMLSLVLACGSVASSPLLSVDPFLGCEGTSLPESKGIAKNWWWPKAQIGNTHPGPCYPFGMVSACAYSGGYPTGYGLFNPSSSGQPTKLHEDYVASGFTHFQQSGTGAIGTYYNYIRVVPLVGDLKQVDKLWKLSDEQAKPGYYSVMLPESGVCAELTVGKKCVVHRYTFSETKEANVVLDITTGGLGVSWTKHYPEAAECCVVSESAVEGRIIMKGLPIYFSVDINSPGWTPAIWADGKKISNCNTRLVRNLSQDEKHRFGVVFSGKSGTPVEVKIGFSLKSTEQARANIEAGSFDDIHADTADTWSDYLSRISVAGGSEKEREIFYTSLYRSLIKPSDFSGENPRTSDSMPFYLDIATMWDVYKTQLPLMLAVYPERGREFVNALTNAAEEHGRFPIAYLMHGDMMEEGFNEQAGGLAHVIIVDAYAKGIAGIDWRKAFKLMVRTFDDGPGKEFAEIGKCKRLTHVLDYSYAAFCTAQLAEALGETEMAKRMMDLSERWRSVFSHDTGRLPDDKYYEGGSWNYSFRLLHDMAGRIALYDDKGDFVRDLDIFFGIADQPDKAFKPWEALNNEADMEAPYSYHYAGRPDRAAEVVRACLKYRFDTGRGGLPGNDDSGGTSSWYVWNAIGLFPVVGQDVYLIGSPLFDKTTIDFSGHKFIIEAKNASAENIYVQSAKLNGSSINRAYLRFSEMKSGGKLILEMGPKPSKWGHSELPPSY